MKTLRHFCLKALPKLISSHIRQVSQRAGAIKWFALFSGGDEQAHSREATLRRQVERLRRHIYENVVWYDHEDVFMAVLKGVEEALCKTRKGWRPESDMEQYRQEMEALSLFSHIVLFPQLRRMEFSRVPKSLRSRIIDNFGTFSNLRTLVLGSGREGQWLFRGTVARNVAKGMEHMARLERFSCKHDCTPEILDAISRTCPLTLRALDVEGSKAVDDKCLGSLLAMANLEELHLFNTKITDEAGARLLMGLHKLTRLVKADFLCESLGWIDYLGEAEEGLKLLVTEFFPSQKYYFHEEWQMEMVSRLCPFITKMFFIFHETCVPDFTVLLPFEYLADLTVFGGSFYADKLEVLLEVRGRQLLSLSLMSTTEVDYLAIALLSVHCPNLKTLSLVTCDVGDLRRDSNPNSDESYERRQAFLDMARTAHSTMTNMGHLEELAVHSRCSRTYLSFLLCRCPRVRRVDLGGSCEVDDDTVLRAYAAHGFNDLQEFHCESSASTGLSVDTARMLTVACSDLCALGDLQAWRGAAPAEVGKFRQQCYEENLNLDTRSHQKLRQILEMRSSERRSHFNLLAGPTTERIRMARQQQQQLRQPDLE